MSLSSKRTGPREPRKSSPRISAANGRFASAVPGEDRTCVGERVDGLPDPRSRPGEKIMNPRSPIEAVFLDWDGTLLDSFEADLAAYLEMFRAMGIDWGREDLARHYSPDWYKVYRAARLNRARWEEADRLWRRAYDRHKPKLVAGARGVLRQLLRRYRLGLVTSGNRSRVAGQLRTFRLTSLFAARVYHEDVRRRKPHPEPLLIALGRMGLPASHSVYVGDCAEDMEMARRAGVRSIGIPGSFPTAKRLRASQPDALIASLPHLPDLLEEWCGAPARKR